MPTENVVGALVLQCGGGFYADSSGSDSCTICPANHECPVSSASPVPCNSGEVIEQLQLVYIWHCVQINCLEICVAHLVTVNKTTNLGRKSPLLRLKEGANLIQLLKVVFWKEMRNHCFYLVFSTLTQVQRSV